MRRIRRYLGAIVAVVGLSVLLMGCPPAVPPAEEPEQPLVAAEDLVPPPDAVRPTTIAVTRAGVSPIAHKVVRVPNRHYLLRNSGSIADYNAAVRREVLRLGLREYRAEAVGRYGGWSQYYTAAVGDYVRDVRAHEEPSPYAPHYWWDAERQGYRAGGSTPATDQAAWVSGLLSANSGAAGGGGGASPGLPGGAGGGEGPGMKSGMRGSGGGMPRMPGMGMGSGYSGLGSSMGMGMMSGGAIGL